MIGAFAFGDSSAVRAGLLRSFLLAEPQQIDHLRDSPLALVAPSGGRPDRE